MLTLNLVILLGVVAAGILLKVGLYLPAPYLVSFSVMLGWVLVMYNLCAFLIASLISLWLKQNKTLNNLFSLNFGISLGAFAAFGLTSFSDFRVASICSLAGILTSIIIVWIRFHMLSYFPIVIVLLSFVSALNLFGDNWVFIFFFIDSITISTSIINWTTAKNPG
jgi:hypothetical protein